MYLLDYTMHNVDTPSNWTLDGTTRKAKKEIQLTVYT